MQTRFRRETKGFAVAAAVAAFLLATPWAAARITTSMPPVDPNASAAERARAEADYKDDVKRWNDAVEACKKKSPAFRDLMEGHQEKGRTTKTPGIEDDDNINVDVQLTRSGSFVDAAELRGGNGSITVNIDNLMRMPDPNIVNKRPGPGLKPVNMLDPPPGMPWGMTRCELMAHFLREAKEMSRNHVASLHADRDPHDNGRVTQNAVRMDFNQGNGEACKSSILPNDETDPNKKIPPLRIRYIGRDGKPAEITPKNQVQIHYGGDNTEVLWWDSEGKLQLAFFHGTTQIARKKVTLPGDSATKLNSDYAMAPGLKDDRESLGAVEYVDYCPPRASMLPRLRHKDVPSEDDPAYMENYTPPAHATSHSPPPSRGSYVPPHPSDDEGDETDRNQRETPVQPSQEMPNLEGMPH